MSVAGPSRLPMGTDDDTVSLARSRPKRSTAGNRLKALLQKGIEPEELFAEVEDDGDYEAVHLQPDIVDSDFGDTTDDEANENQAEAEIQAEERTHRRAERLKKVPMAVRLAKAHRSRVGLLNAIQAATSPTPPPPPEGTRPAADHDGDEMELSDSESDEEDKEEDERARTPVPTRASKRTSTLARTHQLQLKLAERTQRREAQRASGRDAGPRARHKRPVMTQAEHIAAALEMEEQNRESLRVYLASEEERAKRARAPKRVRMEGPFIRWRSVTIKEGGGGRSGVGGQDVVDDVDATVTMTSVTADPVIAARAASQARATGSVVPGAAHTTTTTPRPVPQGEPSASTKSHERTLISLHNLDPARDDNDDEPDAGENDDGTQGKEPRWYERHSALLGSHTSWDMYELADPLEQARRRPRHPRQRICPLTGFPALYRDGRTGTPFAMAEAQHVISDLLEHEYEWTGLGPGGASSGPHAARRGMVLGMGCWMGHEGEEGAAGVVARARRLHHASGS